jgi:poly(hydroxyalkanoate) granule-associated protein
MTGKTETTQDKNLQDELKDSAHRIWLAGLGALAVAEEEGGKLFSRLVDRGREVESRGKVEVDKAVGKAKTTVDKAKSKAGDAWEGVGSKVDDALTGALHRIGVPTRDEIHNLTRRIEELNSKVEQLKPRVTVAGGAGEEKATAKTSKAAPKVV